MPGSITSSTTSRTADRSPLEQALERGLAGVDDVGGVALGFEVEAQALGEVLLVLDDQDRGPATVMRSAARGSSSVKVLPLPRPFALRERAPAMAPRDRADDEEPEAAAAFRAHRHAVGTR